MSLRHFLVVSLVLIASVASAQTISITGRVADPQGAVVSGAVVTLNPSSAAARTTSTTVDGTFTFAGVPAGLSVLQVESPGFERWSPQHRGVVGRLVVRRDAPTGRPRGNRGCRGT
jgi:hypothetical protein